MTKISVIIPTYNCEKYLPAAIDSVLAQTYQDFEIIIIDDGSSDNTKKVVIRYGKKNSGKIKYLYQLNKGAGAARNNGIRNSKGKYIAFLDADDAWFSTKLMEQINLLDQNKETALVFSDLEHRNGDRILYKSYLQEKGYYSLIREKEIFAELVKKVLIYTPTVVVRKSVLEQVGLFNENYRIGEDYDLWLRITNRFKVDFIAKPLVLRRYHDSNITNNKSLYYKEHINFLTDFLKSDLFDRRKKKIFLEQLQNWSYELGCYYFERNEYKDSHKWFMKSFGNKELGLSPFFYFIASLFPGYLINALRKMKCEITR